MPSMIFLGILVVVVVLLGAIPFALKWWIEPFFYRRRVREARRELEKSGLTPEQYMRTINPKDSIAVALAKQRLGLE